MLKRYHAACDQEQPNQSDYGQWKLIPRHSRKGKKTRKGDGAYRTAVRVHYPDSMTTKPRS